MDQATSPKHNLLSYIFKCRGNVRAEGWKIIRYNLSTCYHDRVKFVEAMVTMPICVSFTDAHTYRHTRTRMHIHIHKHRRASTYARTQGHKHIHTHPHTNTRSHTHKHARTHTPARTCTLSTHTKDHTHARTHNTGSNIDRPWQPVDRRRRPGTSEGRRNGDQLSLIVSP